jgi:hypothetical protein
MSSLNPSAEVPPKNLAAKLFVSSPNGAVLDGLVPVFHEWIRSKKMEGDLLLDVVTYEHVPDGPGVMLIADRAHYHLDMRWGQPGIRYVKKDPPGQDTEARLRWVLLHAVEAAKALEAENRVSLRFGTAGFEIEVLDRPWLETTPEAISQIHDTLTRLVSGLGLEGAVSVERVSTRDAREPLAFSIQWATDPRLETLLDAIRSMPTT